MMDIAIWILAGGMIGWAALTFVALNEERGMAVSVVTGMFGGLLGGKVLAPMLGGVAAAPGGFSALALLTALACAAACLFIADKVHQRFGF